MKTRNSRSCKYELDGPRLVAELSSPEPLLDARRREIPPMDFVVIALIIVAVWIGLLVLVLAVCRASGRADAAEERDLAERRYDVPNRSLAPHVETTGRHERKPIDRSELERELERLRIKLPERPRARLTRLVGTRRNRS